MKENVLREKTFNFSIRLINLYKFLKKEHNEFVLSQQVIRSGTAVGAIVRESEHAESIKDFIHKLSIGLKEINETEYWLYLLFATGFITQQIYLSLKNDCIEILKLLTASVKTSKQRLK
ncbi:MAG: four helix bundle protein [Ferruginibacter sp.]